MSHILVVEDEREMLRGLRDNLEFENYHVDAATDGETALKKIIDGSYDLIILDVMLPRLSGLDVCKRARQQGISTPIIMLTARGEEIDKVLGLELGADDYITKPFGVRELMARIKAVIRRAEGVMGAPPERMVVDTLVLDFTSYTATRDNRPLNLSPREYEIMKYLWLHRNKAVSRDELLTQVWGYDDSISTRTVDNFMLKLRQKIEKDPGSPRHIITIHGIGYKLVVH
ncbi:MAG: response regulator transcription factor [Ignavibacteriales bacterium]|nr:response regulator transcription factor [Ignavibacteriales bacterium]